METLRPLSAPFGCQIKVSVMAASRTHLEVRGRSSAFSCQAWLHLEGLAQVVQCISPLLRDACLLVQEELPQLNELSPLVPTQHQGHLRSRPPFSIIISLHKIIFSYILTGLRLTRALQPFTRGPQKLHEERSTGGFSSKLTTMYW